MNKKITINSLQTIVVTPNTNIKDLTDKNNTANPNKLRAQLNWGNEKPVKILQGVFEYNANIEKWDSVKALVDAKIITISKSFDVFDVNENKQKVEQAKKTNKMKLEA